MGPGRNGFPGWSARFFGRLIEGLIFCQLKVFLTEVVGCK